MPNARNLNKPSFAFYYRAMVEPEPDDEEAQEVKSTPEVSTRWNCTIMITVIIEVIILAVVCILEYFLR